MGKSPPSHQDAAPYCGHPIDFHQYLQVTLHHLTIGDRRINLEVTYQQYLCADCHRVSRQDIPFKEPRHLITTALYKMAIELLRVTDASIQGVSRALRTSWKLIKDIDKTNLRTKYGEMKPTHYSPYICVDEFSLHKGHQYATVVLDWQTGEILFLEKGHSERQLLHFFQKVGYEWMSHVQAIAMDMNAQYAKAVTGKYPHIAVVYDAFHIVKNFNDRIITELRRQEQRSLLEHIAQASIQLARLNKELRKGDEDTKEETLCRIDEKKLDLKEVKRAYSAMKGSRFILLTRRDVLRRKDEIARQRNQELYDRSEHLGIPLPSHEKIWSVRNEERLDTILRGNEALNIAVFLSEQLKIGLSCTDEDEMIQGLRQWLALADSYVHDIPMLKSFNKMIRSHFDGITNRVRFPISNGPLEGINNMIKTCRRQAYGYRDEDYFFLKIWDRSRRYVKKRTLTSPFQQQKKSYAQISSPTYFP